MEYNEKSLTREGGSMMALAHKSEKALITDEIVISDKVIAAGTDISTLTIDSFTDAVRFPINSKNQSDNQFTVKAVITNYSKDQDGTEHKIDKDFNVALVGILAHVEGFVDSHILSVAVGNEPFVLPAYQGTPFNLVFGFTQIYSSDQAAKIELGSNDAYALASDIDVLKSTVAGLDNSVNVTIDEKLKDAGGLSKDNVFTGANQFTQDPTNASGDPYVADKTMQAAIAATLKGMLADDGSLVIGDKRFKPVVDNQNDTITVNKKIITPADEDHVVRVNEAGNGSKVNFEGDNLTVDGATAVGMVFVYSDDDSDAVKAYTATHSMTAMVYKDGARPDDQKPGPFTTTTDTTGGTA